MGLGRYPVHHLAGKGQAYAKDMRRLSEKAVVISLAVAKAMPGSVKGGPGNYGYLNAGGWDRLMGRANGIGGTSWFWNALITWDEIEVGVGDDHCLHAHLQGKAQRNTDFLAEGKTMGKKWRGGNLATELTVDEEKLMQQENRMGYQVCSNCPAPLFSFLVGQVIA